MTVLEREAFCDSLLEYAGEAAAGTGRLVFLAGEAGVGKTTLLTLLRERLPDARWAVGACDGAFTPEPLGPLFDIAPQLGGAIAAACAAGEPRDRLFRLLLETLAGGPAYTVLIIEDAHWADDATTDLIRFLGRRLQDLPVLLVVSYRDEGLPARHPLRLTLGDLAAARSLRRMSLPPLSPAAVAELAGGSRLDVDQLYALTGGNPFFLTELLGAPQPTTVDLPVSARDAVLARVARMSAPGRAVLDAAAILGTADIDVVLEVARAAALDECLEHGVVLTDGPSLRWRHELARLAVADAIAAHQQRELHARALAVLRERGADLAQLAHHAEGALDSDAVLDHAVRAGDRAAALSAHREAALQYSRALRFAGDRPPAERAALHDLLATELLIVEEWQRSCDERARAVALWREVGDRLRYGDSLSRLARARLRVYQPEGHAQGEEALAVLEQLPPSVELAWAYANRAAALMYDDPPRSIDAARHARAILEQAGVADAAVVSDALNSEGAALSAVGRDGLPLMEEALRVALAGGAIEQAGRGYTNVVATLVNCADYRRAAAVAEEGVAFCDDHDHAMYAHCLRGNYIGVLDRLGRWDEALELADQELSNPRLSPFNRAAPCLIAGALHARRGNAAAAAALLDEATVTYNDMGCSEDDLRRVELTWLTGDVAGARRRAEALAELPGLAAETVSELAVWLRRVGGDPSRFDWPVDPVRARQLSEPWPAVAAMWAERGAPYEQALALYDAGEEEPMREAIAILDRLGATAAINVVRAEMRRRGFSAIPRGSRPATRADRWGLTPRQREVLELVASGLTNADIAGRLVLSERTVDHHVSALLDKLGADSRQDAARKAGAAGLASATS